MDIAYFKTFARYNRWANERLYAACAKLAPDEYAKPRASFFGSIKGTLNHIMVGDRAWLDRLEGATVSVKTYDEILYDDLPSLTRARAAEDARIIRLIDDLGPDELGCTLYYTTMAGDRAETPTSLVLAHIFNHQTHHRGQAHDQLSQTSVPPPPLDLAIFLREKPKEKA
ncbi:MAG TPA: DinB family protein [Alphaproteobacteria bacterium]|nr:DinB family protein [Alphaproteobacteria bacterium]